MSTGATPVGHVSVVRTYYMIYLILDASPSMLRDVSTGVVVESDDIRTTHLGQLLELIPPMLRELADSPAVRSMLSVSVIGFNDRPQILRPMSALERPHIIRPPERGDYTDYASVLHFVAERHRADVDAVVRERRRDDGIASTARPLVFFVTDGRPWVRRQPQPEAEWLAGRAMLVEGPARARVAALGLHNANTRTLCLLATGEEDGTRNAFIAEADADPSSLANSIVRAIRRSIARSSGPGRGTRAMVFETPAGMRRVGCDGRP